MKIGDITKVEVHNGAILNIETAVQLELNYEKKGNAIFQSMAGNVNSGFLRKSADNAYIISGQ